MFLLRISLPDRPGSLGAVATALGRVQADINAVEIVERQDGYVIDDFMLTVPQGTLPDALVTACTTIGGVDVLWLSYYPERWGLHADVDVLEQMTEEPQAAARILIEAAADVFHVVWAIGVGADGRLGHRTALAPDLTPAQIALLGDRSVPHLLSLPRDWLPGWNETLIASAPFPRGGAIVIARNGGPEFLRSEFARLRLLASLADPKEVPVRWA